MNLCHQPQALSAITHVAAAFQRKGFPGPHLPQATQLPPLSSRTTVIYLKNIKPLDYFPRSPNLFCSRMLTSCSFFFSFLITCIYCWGWRGSIPVEVR